VFPWEYGEVTFQAVTHPWPLIAVEVDVLLGRLIRVGVRLGVYSGAAGVFVRVGVLLGADEVFVFVKVRVAVEAGAAGVLVLVGVFDGLAPQLSCWNNAGT
jgi:hypothetical protein